MRRIVTLMAVAASALLVTGCFKEPDTNTGIVTADQNLPGTSVCQGDPYSAYYKLFVVNEGQMGKNNASLDFFRYTDGMYVKGAFKKMNPAIALGLGDTANDIKVYFDYIMVANTGSGILQVLSALDEKGAKAYDIPACRRIALTTDKAYVTSFAGAQYGKDNVKGKLYRIDFTTHTMSSIEVGFQPEGVAVDPTLTFAVVANSGGYTPGYSNTVSVVELAKFSVSDEIEVGVNPKDVYFDQKGCAWVTHLGDYYSVHSGVTKINVKTKTVETVKDLEKVRVSATYCIGNLIICIGSEDEWDFKNPHNWKLYAIDTTTGSVMIKDFSEDMKKITTPYSVCYNPYTAEYFVGDAVDYVNPGKVWCFDANLKLKWSADSGVNPGHMDLYAYTRY